ncbi:hypothetical protein BMR07_04190, partial [Methylococcaceae bacterium CS1]
MKNKHYILGTILLSLSIISSTSYAARVIGPKPVKRAVVKPGPAPVKKAVVKPGPSPVKKAVRKPGPSPVKRATGAPCYLT